MRYTKILGILLALTLVAWGCGEEGAEPAGAAAAPATSAPADEAMHEEGGEHSEEMHSEEGMHEEGDEHSEEMHSEEGMHEEGDEHSEEAHSEEGMHEEGDEHSEEAHSEEGMHEGGDEHAGAFDREVTIEMTDFAFDPDLVLVTAGESVRFVVTNSGAIEHELRFTTEHAAAEHIAAGHAGHGDESGGHGHDEMLLLVPPGESGEIIVTFDHHADWDIIACLIEGHFEAGMHGGLMITSA